MIASWTESHYKMLLIQRYLTIFNCSVYFVQQCLYICILEYGYNDKYFSLILQRQFRWNRPAVVVQNPNKSKTSHVNCWKHIPMCLFNSMVCIGFIEFNRVRHRHTLPKHRKTFLVLYNYFVFSLYTFMLI